MLNKVPEVTLIFWIIKILSTTVGETAADYLAVQVGLGTSLTMACMAALLAAALVLQLRGHRAMSPGSIGSRWFWSALSELRSPTS